MTDRHLFIVDPVEEFDPAHDTTYIIMRELEKRNHQIWTCRSVDLAWEGGELSADMRRISVSDSNSGSGHFIEIERASVLLDSFDLIWMREDPPFDSQYLYSTYLLERVSVPVINDPVGIRDCNEKLFILDFPDLIPRTWVGADIDSARQFLKSVGDVAVAKSLSGYGGEEVYRLESGGEASLRRLEGITRHGEQTIMLQEFLPSVSHQGDRRVIVVGGEPLGVLSRLPSPGDFRSNLHSGGSAQAAQLTEKEREICGLLKDRLLEKGLHFVGLDLVDEKIIEINVTSPTCVQEINRLGEMRLEKKIVNYVYGNILE